MHVKVSKDLDDLVSDLCSQLDQDDLIELVKQLDAEIADYDFTKELKDYFTQEVEEEDEEDYDIEED